jgi:hypothetical protein
MYRQWLNYCTLLGAEEENCLGGRVAAMAKGQSGCFATKASERHRTYKLQKVVVGIDFFI